MNGRRGGSLFVVDAFGAERDVMKSVPELRNHPKPLGPYSTCVVAGDLVFISAQTPLKPGAKTGEWAAADVGGQTRQCLANIRSILEDLGLTLEAVVKTTVFLADPKDFGAMNDAYKESFSHEPPARSPAKLGIEMPGLKVAVEAIAIYEPLQDE